MERTILKKWESGHFGSSAGYKYLMECLICKKHFEISGYIFNRRKSNGTFCSPQCHGLFKIGKESAKKGKKYPHLSGKKSSSWKNTNEITYGGIHRRIYRTLGKPKTCKHCGKKSSERKLNWANINHKYRWNLDDWISLCISCHRRHDIKNNLKAGNKLGSNQFSRHIHV